MSEERRSLGLSPLTPEESALILQALGFDRETPIYIAAGEIYGGEHRLAQLRAAFPRIVSSPLTPPTPPHPFCLYFDSSIFDIIKVVIMKNLLGQKLVAHGFSS